MKLIALCALLVSAPSAFGAKVGSKVVVDNFGPNNCVALSRSSVGSCVIATNCQGADITQTEFAFDCVNTQVVRHSFGVGGFEANEEFDTEVKCARCDLPTGVAHVKTGTATPVKKVEAAPVAEKVVVKAVVNPAPVAVEAVVKPAPVAVEAVVEPAPVKPMATIRAKKEVVQVTPAPMAHAVPTPQEEIPGAVALRAAAKTEVKVQAKSGFWPFSASKKKAPQGVKYGPDGCVSVYKSEDGHCIMSTDCGKSNVKDYQFGLVCVDKTGSPVKHLFGKDSFDSKETFDTLIKCDQCLGLEDIPDSIALAGEVATMAKDVATITSVMKNISINVQMLNKAVFPPAPGPGPAAAPSPAPAMEAPKAKKALVHQAVTHHKLKHHGNLRRHHHHHHHHRRHHRDEDEDDDDDDDERRDDRDREEVSPIVAAAESLPANAFVASRSVPVMDVAAAAQQMAAASSDDDDDGDDDGNGEDY